MSFQRRIPFRIVFQNICKEKSNVCGYPARCRKVFGFIFGTLRNTAAGRIDKRPRNGFSSAAALLLPGRLYAAGYSREAALQTIGVLNSVAVPLVVLPMAFAGAVAAVCMPAVSAAVQNNNKNLHRIVKNQ